MKINASENVKASMYPRIYRPEPTIKLVGNLLALVFVLLALVQVVHHGKHVSIVAQLVSMALPVSLALTFLYFGNTKITLFEDAIEKENWLSRRRLTRNEILGWRGEFHRAYIYILVPRDPKARNMRLPALFRWDKAFFDWKRSIPHLKV